MSSLRLHFTPKLATLALQLKERSSTESFFLFRRDATAPIGHSSRHDTDARNPGRVASGRVDNNTL